MRNLHRRHNERDGVWNHRRLDYLLYNETVTFSVLLALCEGNPSVTGGFPHKGQWHGDLTFSLICAWTNDWANNRDAGDLRRHRTHRLWWYSKVEWQRPLGAIYLMSQYIGHVSILMPKLSCDKYHVSIAFQNTAITLEKKYNTNIFIIVTCDYNDKEILHSTKINDYI